MGEKVEPICYIFGGYLPEFNESVIKNITDDDFIICADNGLNSALKYGLNPNLIIGDFDSFSGELPKNTEIIKLPVKKDDTDLHFAVKEGIKRGFNNFVLSGVSGGRADMTVATISTLLYLNKRFCRCCVLDKSLSVYITDSSIAITRPKTDCHLSVFPLEGGAEGVTISGAVYNAENITLYTDCPVGVSNAFESQEVNISVKKGRLLIMVDYRD